MDSAVFHLSLYFIEIFDPTVGLLTLAFRRILFLKAYIHCVLSMQSSGLNALYEYFLILLSIV